ncbi:MAG: AMP-binding protein, partial [Actinoplanes sp.]
MTAAPTSHNPPPVSFTALTPLAFLGRAAEVFAEKTAIVYGEREWSYREFAAEATRLAQALRASGVEP